MALRIITGDLKGRKLRSVRGTKTRPTANRIREAIFNILASRIRGAMVLDLFAGTGAFGFEALSRGAEAAVFVDYAAESIAVLKENAASLFPQRQIQIIRWDLTRNLNCLRPLQPDFNLIFMDPPYNKNMIAPTLHNLHIGQSLEKGARIVVEHSRLETVLDGQLPFKLTDQRKYGKTLVSFLRYML
jgi:16S rRNA (guanine966-N2)-methyltransferase